MPCMFVCVCVVCVLWFCKRFASPSFPPMGDQELLHLWQLVSVSNLFHDITSRCSSDQLKSNFENLTILCTNLKFNSLMSLRENRESSCYILVLFSATALILVRTAPIIIPTFIISRNKTQSISLLQMSFMIRSSSNCETKSILHPLPCKCDSNVSFDAGAKLNWSHCFK